MELKTLAIESEALK